MNKCGVYGSVTDSSDRNLCIFQENVEETGIQSA